MTLSSNEFMKAVGVVKKVKVVQEKQEHALAI